MYDLSKLTFTTFSPPNDLDVTCEVTSIITPYL
nr:MAG TPA: hypothetical protein [Caudoviricetes sp.]